ncbi:hypothetical protein OG874_23790 [Nocardia sp. NBC_00565]|uniref:hypothetical protein n=1 Tax=Nocardia sp. NBC_00565 TaxID=2975993 RepID=UPI002E81B4D8|nr:hypothetical protein [Nocardia sp. NBC_00565]WUB99939.1 hypothetical protein OG874_23790 [Nocardia sp. NBC_00565]
MRQTLALANVTAYLRGHGWTVAGRWRSASVWSWQNFDVLVPPTDAAADVTTRLRELVQCVADAEKRSPDAVWRDMTTPAVDIVAYRTAGDPESVTLSAGTRTVLAVRNLIAACAREVLGEPRPTRRDAPSAAVGALLEQSLLTPSVGALGLDVAFPIAEGDPDPLGRRTALRLLHSSAAVRQAADSSETGAFEQIFRQGVSPAECGALAELAGPGETSPFELGFHWSWLIPQQDEAVEFPPGQGEAIRRGSRREDQLTGPTAGIVEGLVISMSDDRGGARWHIKVRGLLEVEGAATGRPRLIDVSLGNSRNYEAAIEAHRNSRIVRAAGTMTGRASGITVTAAGFTVTDRIST